MATLVRVVVAVDFRGHRSHRSTALVSCPACMLECKWCNWDVVVPGAQVVGLATGVGAAGVSASVLTSMFTNPLEDLLALTLSAAGG